MEASISTLVVALAALVVLAVTSMRYGVESRDGFVASDRVSGARQPLG